MDFPALQAHLVAEAARFKAAVSAAPADAPVPSCPEWTTTDLLDHLTETYDHKIQSMRFMRDPSGDFRIKRPGGPAAQFDGALADLLAEFGDRGPDTLSYTWYGPDQTVGFWIRRMAHETLVHRVDAELAAGAPIGLVDPELALDGIDEMLMVMLSWASRVDSAWMIDTITANDGLEVAFDTGSASWTLLVAPNGIAILDGVAPTARATVHGDPGEMLLWLWRRLPVEALRIEGDQAKAAQLYELVTEFAQ